MIVRDAMLAYAHFIAIFVLASLLTSELFIFKQTLAADYLRRLRLIDRWYGIAAGLVIVTGLGRLFLGPKGVAFYAHNPVFWTKMALFVVVALLSIVPTIAFFRLGEPTGPVRLDDGQYARIRTLLWAQVAVFVLIPLCATLMSRGL